MTIISDLLSLTPGAIVELFELELENETLRFHAGTNELSQAVVWRGNTYHPLPVQADGFSMTTGGQIPRPRLRVANIDGVISQALKNTDLVGHKVIRRRTMARYLDDVNFESGNPSADPEAEMTPDVFYIDRKSSETKMVVEFELAASMDVGALQLPKRQIIQNSCTWKYRSPECGYIGGPCATLLDQPTNSLEFDQCGKRLNSCKLRFGETSVLPFGGFPAAGLIRS